MNSCDLYGSGVSGRGSLTMFSVWRAPETRFLIDTFFPSSAAGAPFGGAAAGSGADVTAAVLPCCR
ncbi:MAG: hypothetical protein MZV63_23175 [Marinilabiliales bacterium]|nr:hypothetical protein [Marinilabiliales bacterium]